MEREDPSEDEFVTPFHGRLPDSNADIDSPLDAWNDHVARMIRQGRQQLSVPVEHFGSCRPATSPSSPVSEDEDINGGINLPHEDQGPDLEAQSQRRLGDATVSLDSRSSGIRLPDEDQQPALETESQRRLEDETTSLDSRLGSPTSVMEASPEGTDSGADSEALMYLLDGTDSITDAAELMEFLDHCVAIFSTRFFERSPPLSVSQIPSLTSSTTASSSELSDRSDFLGMAFSPTFAVTDGMADDEAFDDELHGE